MFFPDYVKLLKKNYKKRPGNDDLCTILFDSVIGPLDLKSKNNEMVTFSSALISNIMNRKADIPGHIRDNIYEEKVADTIVDYFDKYIVSDMRPEIDDICLEFMKELDKDEDLSKQRLSEFRMMAKPKTFALFLSQLFVYVVVKENKIIEETELDEDVASALLIKCIKGKNLSDCLDIKTLASRTSIPSVDQMKEIIVGMYHKINDNHINNDESFESFFSMSLYPEVVISENTKDIINTMARVLKIELSEDFYDIKGVKEQPALYNTEFGKKYCGDESAKEKFFDIKKLETIILKYYMFSAYGHLLEDIRFFALVICNDGDTYDEDIRIDIIIPKECFYSVSDFKKLEFEEIKFLMDEMKITSLVNIERSVDYLDYEESYTRLHTKAVPFRMDGMFGHNTTKEDLVEDYENAFDYYIEESDENVVVEIKFDKVLHNTAIAFPQIILLKKEIDKVSYTIKSSNNPKVLKGEMVIDT